VIAFASDEVSVLGATPQWASGLCTRYFPS
jgi:hypothetical protein